MMARGLSSAVRQALLGPDGMMESGRRLERHPGTGTVPDELRHLRRRRDGLRGEAAGPELGHPARGLHRSAARSGGSPAGGTGESRQPSSSPAGPAPWRGPPPAGVSAFTSIDTTWIAVGPCWSDGASFSARPASASTASPASTVTSHGSPGWASPPSDVELGLELVAAVRQGPRTTRAPRRAGPAGSRRRRGPPTSCRGWRAETAPRSRRGRSAGRSARTWAPASSTGPLIQSTSGSSPGPRCQPRLSPPGAGGTCRASRPARSCPSRQARPRCGPGGGREARHPDAA